MQSKFVSDFCFTSLQQSKGWEPCMIWPCPPVNHLGTSLQGAKVHMPTANHETPWRLPVECIVPVSQWKDFDLLNTWHGQMMTNGYSISVWSDFFFACALPCLLIPSLMFITHHVNHALPFFPPDTKEAAPEWNENLRRLCEMGPKPIKPSKRLVNGKWQLANDLESSKYIKYESCLLLGFCCNLHMACYGMLSFA